MPAVIEKPRPTVDIRVDDKGAKPTKPAVKRPAQYVATPGRKRRSRAVPLIITGVALAAIVALIAFDVAGLRTRLIPSLLRPIPFIGNAFPEPEEQADAVRAEELAAQLSALAAENDMLKEQLDSLNKKTDIYVDDNTRLKKRVTELEGAEEDITERTKAFDKMIAEGDPAAYAAFYESVNPQTAEELYQQAALTVQADRELRNYVATFKNMEPASAARILEQLAVGDMELCGLILKNIDQATRGEILSAMKPDLAAAAVKFISPPQ